MQSDFAIHMTLLRREYQPSNPTNWTESAGQIYVGLWPKLLVFSRDF